MTIFHRMYQHGTFHTRSSSGSPRSNEERPVSVLSCSMSRDHLDLFYSSRKLCEDRQRPFEHFTPRRVFKSTIRVTMMQGAHILSKYVTDQIQDDLEREERVAEGTLTQGEADREADEWAETEWNKRFSDFPLKVANAFVKYQATILLMRFYEHLAEKMFKVGEVALDRLTLDTFKYGKRKASEGKEGVELAREMYGVCWRANLISYLADYSVYQVVLAFGYYKYAQEQRQRRRKQRANADGGNEVSDNMPGGPLLLNLVRKSTLLALSRAVSLLCASVGAAFGSMVSPAWGTLIGTNMGDGLAITFVEDFVDSSAQF